MSTITGEGQPNFTRPPHFAGQWLYYMVADVVKFFAKLFHPQNQALVMRL